MKKNPTLIYDILLVLLGIAMGMIIMHVYYNIRIPAYPGPGDWNGDGVVSVEDLFAAVNELINGPSYPEYVIG